MNTPESSRARSARYRARQRARGLRPVLLWLPDVNDPAYRARLDEQCRRMAELTPEENAMANAFERLAALTPNWE